MSFHEITGIRPNMPASAEQFPVFLFPDITGDCLGLFQLAHQLQTARGNKSQIYIWHDPQVSDAGSSLSTYAEKIKNEITKLLPLGPCFIGGYSFGGSLASVVAQKLGAAQRKVSLFVIDTPSIEGSQAYLQAQNEPATHDLVSIFTYAASLASHYTAQRMESPTFSESELKTLSMKPFDEQIERLKTIYIQAANQIEVNACEAKLASLSSQSLDSQLSTLKSQYLKTASPSEALALNLKSSEEQLQALKASFILQAKDNKLSSMLTQYAAVVTQNLLSILRHQDQTSYSPLAKIGLFLSQESQKKYSFNPAKSWDTYCHEGEVTPLADSTHLSLIKNKNNSRLVAEKMSTFFKNYFSTKEIMTMFFMPWVANNPDVDLYELAHELEKSKPTQVRSASSNADQNGSSMPLSSPRQLSLAHTSTLSFSLSPPQPRDFSGGHLPSMSAPTTPTTSPLLASSHPSSVATLQPPTLSPSLRQQHNQYSSATSSGQSHTLSLSPLLSGLNSPGEGEGGMPPLKLADGEMEDIGMAISPKIRRKKASNLHNQNMGLLQQPSTFFTLHPPRLNTSKTTRQQEREQEAALLGTSPQQQLGSKF